MVTVLVPSSERGRSSRDNTSKVSISLHRSVTDHKVLQCPKTISAHCAVFPARQTALTERWPQMLLNPYSRQATQSCNCRSNSSYPISNSTNLSQQTLREIDCAYRGGRGCEAQYTRQHSQARPSPATSSSRPPSPIYRRAQGQPFNIFCSTEARSVAISSATTQQTNVTTIWPQSATRTMDTFAISE